MFKRMMQFLSLLLPAEHKFISPFGSPNPRFIEARMNAYELAFGVPPEIHHSTNRKIPHIDLYVFPPAGERDYVVVVTGGMSDLPMSVPEESDAWEYVELLLCVGECQDWAVNLLKLAAEFPFDLDTYFDVHHTVPFGVQLGDGSSLSAFLLVEPRFLPQNLVEFEYEGRQIRFMQVVAITAAEHQFAIKEGSEKLEPLLEQRGFLITRDSNRRSVVESE